jgi:NAD(P)-dependent dehydrogenase (short-subunit alcohol dehydrogenase family)
VSTFRSALITGASSGIGYAIAERLAARGTRVVVAARRRPELEQLAGAIARAGGRAEICELDVENTDATRETVARWDRDLGGLDLVLANAGIGGTQPGPKITWETVERIMRINVLGAMATLVPLVGPMTERGRGTLSAVTSLAGMRGLPSSAAYSASKAAISIFLESLRVELAPAGVRVVDIRPGFVDTPLTRKNKFKMPFMMDVGAAAEASIRGLLRGDPVVAFPWQLSSAMTLAEKMPDVLWRKVAVHVTPQRSQRS